MNEMEIRIIGDENAKDINIKNEKFELFGRMIPCRQDGKWSYTVEKGTSVGWDIFPDENYDYEKMKDDCIFVGAYDGETCIGLAIFQKQWHKYIYLYDLKVNARYRRRGIAARMLDKASEAALRLGYRGIWTVGQDNNLAACLFYIKNGFVIGGLDTEVYNGTKLEGNADIHFYKEFE